MLKASQLLFLPEVHSIGCESDVALQSFTLKLFSHHLLEYSCPCRHRICTGVQQGQVKTCKRVQEDECDNLEEKRSQQKGLGEQRESDICFCGTLRIVSGPAQSDSEVMALVVAACQEQQRHEQLGRLLEDAWTGDILNQVSQVGVQLAQMRWFDNRFVSRCTSPLHLTLF